MFVCSHCKGVFLFDDIRVRDGVIRCYWCRNGIRKEYRIDIGDGKVCKGCNRLKAVDDFYLSKGKPVGKCKECRRT